eukprot:912090_1
MRIVGTTMAMICQLANSLDRLKLYEEYLFEELQIKDLQIGFYDASDAILIKLNKGNKRRKLMDLVEQWIPPLGSKYDVFSGYFWSNTLREIPLHLANALKSYKLSAEDVKYVSAFELLRDTVIPLLKKIHAVSRDTSITPYLRTLPTDLIIQILMAQKLNIDVFRISSSGPLEQKWKDEKWLLRYVQLMSCVVCALLTFVTLNQYRNSTNNYKGRKCKNVHKSPDGLLSDCRDTINRYFGVSHWNNIVDDKFRLLHACMD